MKIALLNFLREEKALTTVEYAVAGGLITAAAVTAFGLLGGEVARIIGLLQQALAPIAPG